MDKAVIDVAVDDGGQVTVTVRGSLDARAARWLVDVADAACELRAQGLRVDLGDVEGFTADGIDAVDHCRLACAGLPGGVSFHVRRGGGRDALLASLAHA